MSEQDGKDVFFHYDDMKHTSVQKDFLKSAKNNFVVKFSFNMLAYYGKYNLSRKAVDIELVSIDPAPTTPAAQL